MALRWAGGLDDRNRAADLEPTGGMSKGGAASAHRAQSVCCSRSCAAASRCGHCSAAIKGLVPRCIAATAPCRRSKATIPGWSVAQATHNARG